MKTLRNILVPAVVLAIIFPFFVNADQQSDISTITQAHAQAGAFELVAQSQVTSINSVAGQLDRSSDDIDTLIANIERTGTQAQKDTANGLANQVDTLAAKADGYIASANSQVQIVSNAKTTVDNAYVLVERINAGENVSASELSAATASATSAMTAITNARAALTNTYNEANADLGSVSGIKSQITALSNTNFNETQKNQILTEAANETAAAEEAAQDAEESFRIAQEEVAAGERDTALQQKVDALGRNAVAARTAANRTADLEAQIKTQLDSGNITGAQASLSELKTLSAESRGYSTDSTFKRGEIRTTLDGQKGYVDTVEDYELLAPFPISTGERSNSVDFIGYIKAFYMFLVSFSAVLAVFMIVLGGFQYMSTDVIGKKKDGKEKIVNAVIGLVLVLSSWLILYTINPEFVSLKNIFNQEQNFDTGD